MEIPCGKDDKPFYVRGPLDSDLRANQIISQLEKTAGNGNYTFIDGLDNDLDDDLMDDDFEDEGLLGDSNLERLDLIKDYLNRADKLSIEEADEMGDLIEATFIEFIDLEKSDDIASFMTKLEGIEVVTTSPDEMFENCGIPHEQLEVFKSDFDEIEELISEGQKEAGKKLKAHKKKYSDNAASQYLELFLLHTKESKKIGAFIEKSVELYPNFPLINLFWKIESLKKEVDNTEIVSNPEIEVSNALEKVFPNRKIFYVSEMFYLLLFLIMETSQTMNMEQIEALDNVIDEVGLCEEDIDLLAGFIKMAKMTFVVGLIDRLHEMKQRSIYQN